MQEEAPPFAFASSLVLAPMSQQAESVSESTAWVQGPLGTPFFTTTWSVADPRTTIVFVHGYNNHASGSGTIPAQLAAATLSRVFPYDGRGFGHTAVSLPPEEFKGARSKQGVTGGWKRQMEDLEFWVRRESLGSKSGKGWVYGHSMGGLMSLSLPTFSPTSANQSPPLVSLLEGIMVAAPVVEPKSHLSPITYTALRFVLGIIASMPSFISNHQLNASSYQPKKKLVEVVPSDNPPSSSVDPLTGPGTATISTIYGIASAGPALFSTGAHEKWPVDLPLFFHHAKDDTQAALTGSTRFFDRLPSEMNRKQFVSLEGDLHGLAQETPAVQASVVRAMAEFVRGVPERA